MPKTKYEADSGAIHTITMSADRIAVAGTPPAGDVDSDIRVKISKTDREFGIKPRGVSLARTVGTAPDTATKYSFLPVLSQADFTGSGFSLGTSITYGGFTWEIVARFGEDF